MLSRRELWVFALVPFCALGGTVLRAKERVEEAVMPKVPERLLGSGGIQYFWTDGTEYWFSGWDAPEGTPAYTRWPDGTVSRT